MYQYSGVDASAPGKMYRDMKSPHCVSCQFDPLRRPATCM